MHCSYNLRISSRILLLKIGKKYNKIQPRSNNNKVYEVYKRKTSTAEDLKLEKGGIISQKCLHNFILLQVLFLNTRLHTKKRTTYAL